MKSLLNTFLLAFIFAFSFSVAAQDDGYTLPFEVSGFVDGYYMFNANESGFNTSFTEEHNTFTLGMANVVLSKTEGNVGFVADIAVGPRAEVANGYTGTSLSAIKQLYMTYSPSDAVTLTFGNFGTFVGYEIIDAPGNANYSTSYLFSNGPFYHTGLKADFAINDNFGAMVGIFNDTDSKFDEIAGKHLGAQLSASFGGFSGYLNFIAGKEEELGDDDLNEYEIDFTGTYDVSDDLMLGLNVANYGTSLDGESQGGFTGAAVYVNFAATENIGLNFRAEQFVPSDGNDDTDDAGITALTLTAPIGFGSLSIMPEVRVDLGDDLFLDADGAATGSQFGFLVGAVYSF